MGYRAEGLECNLVQVEGERCHIRATRRARRRDILSPGPGSARSNYLRRAHRGLVGIHAHSHPSSQGRFSPSPAPAGAAGVARLAFILHAHRRVTLRQVRLQGGKSLSCASRAEGAGGTRGSP
jgi:hypothetical protein